MPPVNRPPVGGPLANPEAAKAAYPIQVRIAYPVAKEDTDSWLGWQPWRLWSHHFRLDYNVVRSLKEAKRDNPDAYVVVWNTETQSEIADLATEKKGKN